MRLLGLASPPLERSHIETVEVGFFADLVVIAAPRQVGVGDIQDEMLGGGDIKVTGAVCSVAAPSLAAQSRPPGARMDPM
jgi:hypothetical protein